MNTWERVCQWYAENLNRTPPSELLKDLLMYGECFFDSKTGDRIDPESVSTPGTNP